MTNDNLQIIKKFIDKCGEFEDCKLLFLDKKISELLETVVQTKEIYDLISECMENFNKDKEYDKAFVVGANGSARFIEPKEEYKIIALDFCLLVDISSGKKSVDALITKYFKSEDDKKDYEVFVEKIIYAFRNLVCEAFGVSVNAMNYISNSTEEQISEDNIELDGLMKITNSKISKRLYDGIDLSQVYSKAKEFAMELLDVLAQEKINEFTVDAEQIAKSIVLASLNEDFDSVYGLALGLRSLAKSVKSIRFLTREIVSLLQEQIDWSK